MVSFFCPRPEKITQRSLSYSVRCRTAFAVIDFRPHTKKMKARFSLLPSRAVKMSKSKTYAELVKENEELRGKVKKCAEGVVTIKETMEKIMEATMKSQAETVAEVEKFHTAATKTAMKLLSAEMSVVLLRVENKELRRRLRATEPEGEVAEEGGEEYEPDYEWLSELERNR